MTLNKFTTFAVSVASLAALAVSTAGVVDAATITPSTTTNTTKTVGSSTIPRDVFRAQRLSAEATILNTTPSAIQTARKDKSFEQLLTKAGLTHKTFRAKVKAQLTTNLKAKGYSQDQITIALQHRELAKLHHQRKKG
ncbi:MAG: hypothetical protein JWN38_92 [Candidatus Saccharibacteria bacterium]|nr:hypothetical protein [Candidatus Saccharibacteria bacterium]